MLDTFRDIFSVSSRQRNSVLRFWIEFEECKFTVYEYVHLHSLPRAGEYLNIKYSITLPKSARLRYAYTYKEREWHFLTSKDLCGKKKTELEIGKEVKQERLNET